VFVGVLVVTGGVVVCAGLLVVFMLDVIFGVILYVVRCAFLQQVVLLFSLWFGIFFFDYTVVGVLGFPGDCSDAVGQKFTLIGCYNDRGCCRVYPMRVPFTAFGAMCGWLCLSFLCIVYSLCPFGGLLL
jgi:hypothetical protein